MTELQLYKFVTDENIEWHRELNDGNSDVVMFPKFDQLSELCKIFSTSILDDEGLNVILKDGYIAIWMDEVCEYHGVRLENVFVGDGW
jgi:hypothetical protein